MPGRIQPQRCVTLQITGAGTELGLKPIFHMPTQDILVRATSFVDRRQGWLAVVVLEVEVALLGSPYDIAHDDTMIFVDCEQTLVEGPVMASAQGEAIAEVVGAIILHRSDVSRLRFYQWSASRPAQAKHSSAHSAGVVIEHQDQVAERGVTCQTVSGIDLPTPRNRRTKLARQTRQEEELFAPNRIIGRRKTVERRP